MNQAMDHSGNPVVLIHRYFAPDTPPYAHILSEIAQALADTHPVTVISGNVPYRVGTDLSVAGDPDVGVVRVRLIPERQGRLLRKALNAPLFAIKSAVAAGRRARGGVIMAATTPPVLVAFSASVAARLAGASFVYHNQDIYPEILPSYFAATRPALPLRLIRALDRLTGTLSTRIVVLSEDMRDLWVQRGIPADRIAVINNFVAGSFHGNLPSGATSREAGDTLRIAYVGNIGPLQDLPRVLTALRDEPAAVVDVYGDGRDLQRLRSMDLGSRITLHGSIPSTEVGGVLQSADLGLVSLVDGVERAAYPSKILTLLTMGVPLLAFLDPASHLAAEIRDNGLGYVVAKDDPAALSEALDRHLRLGDDERRALRERCVHHAERFSQAEVLPAWKALFDDVLAISPAGVTDGR